jgi:hypothetical protein
MFLEVRPGTECAAPANPMSARRSTVNEYLRPVGRFGFWQFGFAFHLGKGEVVRRIWYRDKSLSQGPELGQRENGGLSTWTGPRNAAPSDELPHGLLDSAPRHIGSGPLVSCGLEAIP